MRRLGFVAIGMVLAGAAAAQSSLPAPGSLPPPRPVPAPGASPPAASSAARPPADANAARPPAATPPRPAQPRAAAPRPAAQPNAPRPPQGANAPRPAGANAQAPRPVQPRNAAPAAAAAGAAATAASAAAAAPPQPAAPPEPQPTQGQVSGLPLPRFAALRSDEVNLRTGPGTRFPIEWTYQRRDLPVEIIREFELWRRIRDMEGTEGWVHQSNLQGRRSFIVTGEERPVRARPEESARVVARLRPGVIGRLQACPEGSAWCEVRVGEHRGFLRRNEIWGVRPDEGFN